MQLDATAHWCACSAHPQTGVQAMVWFCLRPTNNLSDIPSRDKFGLLQELNSTMQRVLVRPSESSYAGL